MNYPEIRIKKSFLLNDKVIPLLAGELAVAGRESEALDENIDQTVSLYSVAWEKYEERVIPELCNVLDLEFKQNIIDIYIAPFGNSFSDPMVISTKYIPDRAVDVITHEIIHRLLTDNNKLPLKNGMNLSKSWTRLYGEHSFNTLVHIPVHAILKYIFIDVLNEPERLERDIGLCHKHEHYRLAWEYVKKVGYNEVVEKIKNSYTD